jgi:hypothetical protein
MQLLEVTLIVSDYGGQNDLNLYQSLSFLFTNPEKCRHWFEMRKEIRGKYFIDNRRISFKKMNDSYKKRILVPFLSIADSIPGLIVIILVDKKISTLFVDKNEEKTPELTKFRHWKFNSFEKMMRVVHFTSFFSAGLSREGQNLVWFSDEDEIIADDSRLSEVTNILGIVLSHYLKHNLRQIRLGTTKSDDSSRELEDLASIPDLIAGALSEALTAQQKNMCIPRGSIFLKQSPVSDKTEQILHWFAHSEMPLKRLVFLVEETNPLMYRIIRLNFITLSNV